jgi:DNA-binding CsgD family transcriptional regulator
MASETELSEREIEILRLVATGVSNKEIAVKLAISPNTVKVHLRNVFAKIGAASRTEAAFTAVRMGLVENSPILESTEVQLEEPPDPAQMLAVLPDKLPENPQNAQHWLRRPAGSRQWLVWVGLGILLLALVVTGSLALARSGPFAPLPTATIQPSPTAVILPQASGPSRWSEVSSLPAGRSGMAAAVYEGALYVIGGETAQGTTSAVLRYRASPGGWETLAEKPTPVSDVQAVVVGERIFVPGGKDAGGKAVKTFEVYLPRLNKWEQLAPLPAALSGYALAASEGRLYLFGGWDGDVYSAAVYSYDPAANTWQMRTALPSARAFAAAVLVEGRIYIAGGFDGQQSLRTVLVYFPGRDQGGDHPWEERAPLSEGRYGMGATTLANYFYLVGGINDTNKAGGLPPVQYHTLSDRWTAFEVPPTPVGVRPAVLALDTRLYVLGGLGTAGPQASHQTYQAIYTIMLPAVQE